MDLVSMGHKDGLVLHNSNCCWIDGFVVVVVVGLLQCRSFEDRRNIPIVCLYLQCNTKLCWDFAHQESLSLLLL